MRTYQRQAIGWILLLLACGINPLRAQDQADESFITISGVVKDKQTKKRLGYVNLSVPGTSVGTITNEEGEFSIKVRNSLRAAQVKLSHIGYFNDLIKVEGKNLSDYTVWLEPNTNSLAEVIVRADDPREIVKEAFAKVGDNYVATGNMLTGFYRETAQKGRRYINISEAIIDIYKTPYANRNVDRDRVQIYKGRKLLSQKASNTLAIKLLGGPNLSVYLDVVKNPNLLFAPETLPYYAFRMEESTMLNDLPHYVISFAPAYVLPYALYYGKLFIDKVLDFADEQFWGAYNIIEPTESLANAVHKLKKQQ